MLVSLFAVHSRESVLGRLTILSFILPLMASVNATQKIAEGYKVSRNGRISSLQPLPPVPTQIRNWENAFVASLLSSTPVH